MQEQCLSARFRASPCAPVATRPALRRSVALPCSAVARPHSALRSAGRPSSRLPAQAAASPAAAVENWSDLSYSRQYDLLFAAPHEALDAKKPLPKPNRHAQELEPSGRTILLSDVNAVPKRSLFNREWTSVDIGFLAFIGGMHAVAALAPFTYSPAMLPLFFATYFVSGCLGITLGFHRMLSHRSFVAPKWLEYTLAYCGVLAAQGDPIEWVSTHRYHHLHCDTPMDPHSTYEGFWWAHMGWMLDQKITAERVGNRSNAADLLAQPFYKWLQDTWIYHVALQLGLLFAFGGLPAVVWGGALRFVWVYHITWFVNSASHLWGSQEYDAGDLSRNNWWVGILAFGEGWHNNHHAFEYSARHGLEWWQFDGTWYIIRGLELAGLVTNVKLPTEKAKDKLRIKTNAVAGGA